MHATPGPRFRAPWLIVMLAALGVIALAVGVVRFAPSSCASVTTRTAAEPARGEAVFYNPAQIADRCSIEPLASDGLYASLSAARYQGGALCGAYLDVTGPRGSVEAEIVDMCPGCAPDQLDLSRAAFARVQSTPAGTAPVSYQVARDPALPAPLAVRIGPGSNAGAFAIQVLNHGNPLTGVRVNGRALSLRPDGYWIASTGAGSGPFDIRVTDTLGHDAVLTGITLRPGTLQQTAVRMYGSAVSTAPSPAPSPGPVTPGSVAQRASVTASGGPGAAAGKTC
jgi:expansin (peptidoglycan-binding protein)